MPTASQIKQFLIGTVLPLVVATLSTWLVVHVHLLALFHLSKSAVAAVISQLGVFGITAALSWLTSHHVLKGTYAPSASGGVPAGAMLSGTAGHTDQIYHHYYHSGQTGSSTVPPADQAAAAAAPPAAPAAATRQRPTT